MMSRRQWSREVARYGKFFGMPAVIVEGIMTKYIAFLRGINSGGNQTVRMEVLRKTFEDLGFENVKTVLASGNVIFETDTPMRRYWSRRLKRCFPGSLALGARSLSAQ